MGGKPTKNEKEQQPSGEAVQSNECQKWVNKIADAINQNDDKEIKLEKIKLNFSNKFVIKIRGALSDDQCKELIKMSEQGGFEKAMVNIGNNQQEIMKDFRDSDRFMLDNKNIANAIYEKIKPFLINIDKYRKIWKPREINERFRYLKYGKGNFFKKHRDGSYERPYGHENYMDESMLTVIIYLNEEHDGYTTFYSDDEFEKYDCVPETGMILIHEHDILHAGTELNKGVKYIIRSDIMYKC